MKYKNINPSLACVYSLPRSGSTALIVELDRLKGVICLPESYFPQILELLSPGELSDSRRLAALYLASSPSGSLLSFEEAQACMVPNNHAKTLVNLGLASALKTNRDPTQVVIVIWKTTRIISCWKLFLEVGGPKTNMLVRNSNLPKAHLRMNFTFSRFFGRKEKSFGGLMESHGKLRKNGIRKRVPFPLPSISGFIF